ncbi:hypothetical protein OG423_02695 [Micromonospora zamorensis]|uniref:hypothetical protein n=1 Tax=Micromonospora zamorensis TaxID=709883 RepID=UPI00081F873B|nr:hypothetical protein [Micromonospora zamorensis]WSK49353.1 hypothetical protein OG423_02695 [Micromonospora zamorensis]SCG54784.1 hypothetical protein GA0070619_3166 [Micromonospora zamorensis]
MPVTHWIYPTNEKSNYYLDTANGDTEVSPQQLFSDIRQSRSEVDRWVLGTGFRQMRPGDAIWVYASTPYQYICALTQAIDIDFDGDFWHASLVWNLDATQRLMHDPIRRSTFGQIAQRAAVRANQHTAEVLDEWLTTQQLTLLDLGSEPSPREDTRLRTLRTIVQRQGQHAFRQGLLGAYGGRAPSPANEPWRSSKRRTSTGTGERAAICSPTGYFFARTCTRCSICISSESTRKAASSSPNASPARPTQSSTASASAVLLGLKTTPQSAASPPTSTCWHRLPVVFWY